LRSGRVWRRCVASRLCGQVVEGVYDTRDMLRRPAINREVEIHYGRKTPGRWGKMGLIPGVLYPIGVPWEELWRS
jgi:hypothetical protein